MLEMTHWTMPCSCNLTRMIPLYTTFHVFWWDTICKKCYSFFLSFFQFLMYRIYDHVAQMVEKGVLFARIVWNLKLEFKLEKNTEFNLLNCNPKSLWRCLLLINMIIYTEYAIIPCTTKHTHTHIYIYRERERERGRERERERESPLYG